MQTGIRPGLSKTTQWLLAPALFLIASPAAAATSDSRVNSVAARLDAASRSLCEIVEPGGEVTSCVGDISIVKSRLYNAWARDGRISLTSRLVDISSEDELAFVLAHEMMHVILGHPGSSRKNELAADYWAAKIMTRSGFDANAAGPVLARLQTRRILGFPFSLFSHPANSRRLRTIRRALDEETALAMASSAMQTGSTMTYAFSALP